MTADDLIESSPRPPSPWRRRGGQALRRPAWAALALAVVLAVGSVGGFVGGFAVGRDNPRPLAVLGYLLGSGFGEPNRTGLEAFLRTYGRTPLPALTRADLTAIGEEVSREVSVLSAQSAIPVLCDTSIGQPGTPNYVDLRYPATVFRVGGGELTQLIWPHPDEAAASGALHTLVFQAEQCPDVPNFSATMVVSEVLTGIGDEYAIFTRQPVGSGQLSPPVATAVLVRLGPDLIEIALVSEGASIMDAQARCLRVAGAAIDKAASG